MANSIKTKLDEQAYERDGYQCVKCGQNKGIEAHHIVSGLEELDNLVTLCHACHKREHNMAGCFHSGYDPKRRYNLTIRQAQEIKWKLEEKIPARQIARETGVSRGAVRSIQFGESWAWL